MRLDRVEGEWSDRFQQYETNQERLSNIEPEALLAFGQKLIDVAAERIAAEAQQLLWSR